MYDSNRCVCESRWYLWMCVFMDECDFVVWMYMSPCVCVCVCVDVDLCCGFMLWMYVVDVCCGCMLWMCEFQDMCTLRM